MRCFFYLALTALPPSFSLAFTQLLCLLIYSVRAALIDRAVQRAIGALKSREWRSNFSLLSRDFSRESDEKFRDPKRENLSDFQCFSLQKSLMLGMGIGARLHSNVQSIAGHNPPGRRDFRRIKPVFFEFIDHF